MNRAALVLAIALLASVAIGEGISRSSPLRQFPARISIAPKQAKVFRGDSLQFRTSVVGDPQGAQIRWSLVGPGTIDFNGLYRASVAAPASADIVASTGAGTVDSATVQTVVPPGKQRRLALISCFEDGTIDVRDARDTAEVGAFSVTGSTGGIAIDKRARRAFFALESQLAAANLDDMRWQASAVLPGARLSGVTTLAWGYAAATDNNAQSGKPGVYIFRADRNDAPMLVSSVAAGETPEGIVAADGGHTFFVSNINGSSVMRYALAKNGVAKITGIARTGARPFGVAIDPVHKLLFVADNDTATINGAKSRPGLERFALPSLRRVGAVIRTGSDTSLPLGAAVDVRNSRLFVTNEGDANVVVFSIPAMRRIATFPTGLTPWLPALDETAHRLYVPNARAHSIGVYDTTTLRTIARDVPTCAYPTSIAISNS